MSEQNKAGKAVSLDSLNGEDLLKAAKELAAANKDLGQKITHLTKDVNDANLKASENSKALNKANAELKTAVAKKSQYESRLKEIEESASAEEVNKEILEENTELKAKVKNQEIVIGKKEGEIKKVKESLKEAKSDLNKQLLHTENHSNEALAGQSLSLISDNNVDVSDYTDEQLAQAQTGFKVIDAATGLTKMPDGTYLKTMVMAMNVSTIGKPSLFIISKVGDSVSVKPDAKGVQLRGSDTQGYSLIVT